MTNRRRTRLAGLKKPSARRSPTSTVNPNLADDDKRRSHGARRSRGAERNGPTGGKGNGGRAPKWARLVGEGLARKDAYGSPPKSHKRIGWA